MKKRITQYHIAFILITMLIISSCVTSNHVSNNRLIQKRKHNKGWHFNKLTLNKDNKAVEKSDSHAEDSRLVTIEEDPQQLIHTALEEKSSVREFMNTSSKSDYVDNSDNSKSVQLKQVPKKKAGTIFRKSKLNDLMNSNSPISIDHIKKNISEGAENKKPNARRLLSIIGWSIVLIGLVFSVVSIFSYGGFGGGFFISVVIALVGLVLLIIAARQPKKGELSNDKSKESVGKAGFVLLLIASLLGAGIVSFLIGLAFWSEIIMMVALIVLLSLVIVLFVLWSIKRKKVSS